MEIEVERLGSELLKEMLHPMCIQVATLTLKLDALEKEKALEQANLKQAHRVADHILDRMLVEQMLQVIRDKGPRLIIESACEHLLDQWIVISYFQLLLKGDSIRLKNEAKNIQDEQAEEVI